MPNERQNDLLMLLLARGQTPVAEIADALSASLATVRRDLNELEQAGRIERLHGAARIVGGQAQELAFAAREQQNLPAKRAIATQAATKLRPHETIFLDAGTTILQLVHHMRLTDTPLKVITNGLAIAQALSQAPQIDLMLLGGRVRAENQSTVGPAAHAMLDTLWCDHLFLGATAIDDSGVLSSIDPDEAAINARVITRSAAVHVLADSSKFGLRKAHQVAALSRGMTLITDATPTGAWTRNGPAIETVTIP